MPAQVVVQGTLKPDGTLELDQIPNLEPGRVTDVLQRAAEPALAEEGWWPYLQRIRAEREAAGYPFMNEAEMNAYIEWMREGDRIVVIVGRVLGMQGRKPSSGAPLMKIELDDGTTAVLREDAYMRVLRDD